MSNIAPIHQLMNSPVRALRLQAFRRMRAYSATKEGIRYKMGHGGFFPGDPSPTRTGKCDCSGFVAWLLPMSRDLKSTGKAQDLGFAWIETTRMYNDARGPRKLFVELDSPVNGCFLVYPDRGRGQGHVAYLVDSVLNMGYDCSSRGWRNAIRYRDLGFMLERGAVPVMPREEASELGFPV